MTETKHDTAVGCPTRTPGYATRPNICRMCRNEFNTDHLGRREHDGIKNDQYCDFFCNLAYVDMIEGRSITDVVMMLGTHEGGLKIAAKRVRNVFDAQELESALKKLALLEAERLGHNV